jgi:hypothetical protein
MRAGCKLERQSNIIIIYLSKEDHKTRENSGKLNQASMVEVRDSCFMLRFFKRKNWEIIKIKII